MLSLDALNQFAHAFWQDYRCHGPGRIDSDLFEKLRLEACDVLATLDQLATSPDRRPSMPTKSWLATLRTAVRTILDLAHQCVSSPQGIDFITGEGGLIPRRDLRERFDEALRTIQSAREQFSQDSSS